MNSEIKTGIGYLIPAGAIIGFILALIGENYLLSVFIPVAGILAWFLYGTIMEASLPKVAGNIIMLFTIMLSLGVFLSFGVDQNMFGGFEIKTEGFLFALMILLFGIMAGVLFNRSTGTVVSDVSTLSAADQKIVETALDESIDESKNPKVIIVKQEASPDQKTKETENPETPEPFPYMGAYPPPEYYDYDEEDDDDEEEYEDEDYEWEDEEDEEE